EGLSAKGYKVTSAQVDYLPSTETAIDDPELQEKMSRLLDLLDDNDDVQNVWNNWDAPAEE
ncbi:MAG: YebC/PmpR family DNA-binding transcriptional regulator, partial [Angelakisella sp.]